MTVANTQTLLDQLNNGELDFAIVEGMFDKSKYDTTLFSQENFIPVCSPLSEDANREVTIKDLTKSRLILRESGSGTREIFENILQKNNYSLDAFNKVVEVSNMSAIKKMVSNNLGISFMFEVVARKEIESNTLSRINLSNYTEQREFNFVYLKNSYFRDRIMNIYQLLKQSQ